MSVFITCEHDVTCSSSFAVESYLLTHTHTHTHFKLDVLIPTILTKCVAVAYGNTYNVFWMKVWRCTTNSPSCIRRQRLISSWGLITTLVILMLPTTYSMWGELLILQYCALGITHVVHCSWMPVTVASQIKLHCVTKLHLGTLDWRPLQRLVWDSHTTLKYIVSGNVLDWVPYCSFLQVLCFWAACTSHCQS